MKLYCEMYSKQWAYFMKGSLKQQATCKLLVFFSCFSFSCYVYYNNCISSEPLRALKLLKSFGMPTLKRIQYQGLNLVVACIVQWLKHHRIFGDDVSLEVWTSLKRSPKKLKRKSEFNYIFLQWWNATYIKENMYYHTWWENWDKHQGLREQKYHV